MPVKLKLKLELLGMSQPRECNLKNSAVSLSCKEDFTSPAKV